MNTVVGAPPVPVSGSPVPNSAPDPVATVEERVVRLAGRKPDPFDFALAFSILREAAEDYAWRHGEPGSMEYRAAWLRFRRHVKSLDDLHRLRSKVSREQPKA